MPPLAPLHALILVLALAGATPAAASDPLAPCRALAEVARANAAKPEVRTQATFDAGAAFAPGFKVLPNADPTAAVAGAIRSSFGDDARGLNIPTQRFGRGVWRAEVTEGTLECRTDHFIRFDQEGRAIPMADAIAFSDLCWTSSRTMATLKDGQLALVETDGTDTPDRGADVEVTPWVEGGWGPACRASLRYTDVFRVAERFCQDEMTCGEAERLAPRLAETFARSPRGEGLTAVSPVDAAGAARLALLTARVGKVDNSALPTFGARPKTEYPDFSTSRAVAVQLDDGPFVVRVGQGGIGWRSIGDYLVAVYDPRGADLQPVASYVVKREAVGVKSLTVSVPTPYVNTH